MLISPLIVSLFKKIEAGTKQVNLYISPRSDELFGKQTMENLIREFESLNSDIKIRLAGGSLGETSSLDILIFDEGDFSALVATDALLELNSFTNYDSGTRQLAIPLVSFMDLFFYNINILSAAGFASPPKTRDEFLTYARAVSRGESNAAGSAISLSSVDRQALSRDIFSWIWASGGSFWEGEAHPTINTRAMVNDLTFFGILNREKLLASDIFETTGEQRIEQFAQGKIAMMVASARAIPYLRGKLGDDSFGITTIPYSTTGGRYHIGLSAVYTGININSAYPDEAWKFLEFLTERCALLCAELKAIPGVVSDIIPGDYVKEDFFYSKAWDIFESARIGEGFTGKPGAMEYKTAVLEELEIFFETDRSAQETANAIQRRWDSWNTLD